jgi:Zn-dependent protease
MLVLLIPSITFHEFMHGYAAYRLGDPTAKNAGRLTLNPIKSIDPIGTILLPLLMFASGGPIFGYAKPVPYNPMYFKNLRKGELITGFSGPAANLALALFGAALAWGAVFVYPFAAALGQAVYLVGSTLTLLNLVLMFFNLIPIPPLDGSSIVPIFLPDSAMRGWYQIQRYSFVILIGLLWGLPMIFPGLDLIGTYFRFTVDPLMKLLLPG